MRKFLIQFIAIIGFLSLVSFTASWLYYSHNIRIVGSLRVDSAVYLPNITSSYSDTILVKTGDSVYYQLVTINGDTLFWGADTIVSGSTISITDNQIAVGTGTGIEGDANFTWNGSTFVIVGEATITPNSATTGLLIDQNNNYHGLSVDCESTNYYGITVQSPQPMVLYQDAANGRGLWVYRNNDAAEASELVSFYNDHASDTKPTLQLGNDGSGAHITTRASNEDLEINPNGTGVTILEGAIEVTSPGSFSDGYAPRLIEMVVFDTVTHNAGMGWRELFRDGVSLQMVIPPSTIWSYKIQLVGITVDAGAQEVYNITGVIERDAGNNTTIAASNIAEIFESDVNFNARTTADNTNEALIIAVIDAGNSGVFMRWSATIRISELTFASP